MFSRCSVSMTMRETMNRTLYLSSAGTTCHGAVFLLVTFQGVLVTRCRRHSLQLAPRRRPGGRGRGGNAGNHSLTLDDYCTVIVPLILRARCGVQK